MLSVAEQRGGAAMKKGLPMIPGPRFGRRKFRDLLDGARKRDPRLTISGIAFLCGVAPATLYEYRKERTSEGKPAPMPDAVLLYRLASVLECEPEDMMEFPAGPG